MSDTGNGIRWCRTPLAPPLPHSGNKDALLEFVTFKDLLWPRGSTLTYGFVPGGDFSATQADAVRAAWQTWHDTGINLKFRELADYRQATIRIEIVFDGSSVSQVGLYNSHVPSPEKTMHLGWDLTDDFGMATALHEIGHALGLQHEHQNPSSPIVWNEAALIERCAHYTPPWSEQDVRDFIIDRFDPAAIDARRTSGWDPHSIMHYNFVPDGAYHPISAPEPWASQGIPVNYELSPNDIAWAKLAYP